MNCSNKSLEILRALCVAAIFIFSVNACTKVDNRLGGSLLPKNQRMKARVQEITGMETYLYRAPDGIASSRLGHGYLGKERDEVFGNRTNSLVAQFLPSSYPTSLGSGKTTYANFGFNPVIDSIRIVLTLDNAHGDTTKLQTFEVFDLLPKIELTRDSVYYTDIPIDDYKGDKLFDFTHSGKTSVATRLNPTAKGKEYLKKIIATDMKDYINDTMFHERFRGLYIAPAGDSDSPQDAAVYAADLSASGLELYMRIHDSLDVTAIYDTTYCTFLFRDTDDTSSGYTLPWKNVSVNKVDFEYPAGSTLGSLETATDGFTDTLPADDTQPLLYIQSMGGVTGFLRFNEEMMETLQNLKFEIDEESGEEIEYDIQIYQAMMYVRIDEGEDIVETLDGSIERLGSYTDLKHLVPIPDYMYTYEVQYQSQNAEYKLPYNGYLNRSNAYYEFDISSFVQQLAKQDLDDPDAPDPAFKLAPDVFGMFGFGQSILKGDDINIRLTYALIEKPGKKK